MCILVQARLGTQSFGRIFLGMNGAPCDRWGIPPPIGGARAPPRAAAGRFGVTSGSSRAPTAVQPASGGGMSSSAAIAALRPFSAMTEPAGWVAAPHMKRPSTGVR
jgi:hypothetical protein